MKSIDIKSLIISILGTALIMVLMGQSVNEKPSNKIQISCFGESLKFGRCVLYNNDVQKFIGQVQVGRIDDVTDTEVHRLYLLDHWLD